MSAVYDPSRPVPAPLAGGSRAAAPTWQQLAAFYVALPILLSFPQGWSQLGPKFSLPASLAWWALTWLVAWTFNELFSRVAAAALRPWRPPLWVVLLIGSLVAGFSSRWWTVPLFDFVALFELPPDAESYRAYPRDLQDRNYLERLAQALVSGAVAWLAANYLFERITGVPRLADSTRPRRWMLAARQDGGDSAPAEPVPPAAGVVHAEGPPLPTAVVPAERTPLPQSPAAPPAATPAVSAPLAAAPPPQEPRFLVRMTRYPGTRLDDVLAVEAEDHYVKVHTTRGAELVYYRFADALDDLRGHDGLQVHRSFWVRCGAIEHVETAGRQWELRLTGGLRVPVSRSNQGAVRLAGFAR